MSPLTLTRLSTVLFPMVTKAARLLRRSQVTVSCHVAFTVEGGERVNVDLASTNKNNNSVVALPDTFPSRRPAWPGQIISCSSLDLCSPQVQLIHYQQSE